MARKPDRQNARLEQGRGLARRLYDLKIRELESLSADSQSRLRGEFPLLGEAEFKDVLRQVIEAKRYAQERVGWQAIPHDAAVLVFVIVTALLNLRTGVVVGIATLALLESLFQVYFNRRLYTVLSVLVWLTYPAYAVLAFVLYRRGFEILWIVGAVLLAWGGTFVLGALTRVPLRLLLEARAKGARDAEHKKSEQAKNGR